MGKSPCSTDSHLASQKFLLTFMKSQGSLPFSQEPTIGPYPESHASSPQFPTLLL